MVILLQIEPVGEAAETLGSVLVDLWNGVKGWPAWTLIPIFFFFLFLYVASPSSGLTPHKHDKYSGKEIPTR